MSLMIAERTEVEKVPSKVAVEKQRMKDWLAERIENAKGEPLTEVVTLTPILARLLLEKNEQNRPVSSVALGRFKRDISEGRWQFNGEPIILSKDGLLNDGQHRCTAVGETGKSIRIVMVFGAPRESRMTLDQGVMRTVGHYLGMQGFTDPNRVAAVAGMVWQQREYQLVGMHADKRPTKSQVLLAATHYKGISDSVRFCARQGAGSLTSISLLGFVHFSIAHVAGRQPADAFMDKLLKGNDLGAGDPILAARNRLLNMRRDTGSSMMERAELLFRAWNFHRKGQTVDRIIVGGKKLPKLEA